MEYKNRKKKEKKEKSYLNNGKERCFININFNRYRN